MLSQSDFLVKLKGKKKQVDKWKKELALAERHTVFTHVISRYKVARK